MPIDQTELRYQLALSRAPHIGATTFRALLKQWKTAQSIFNASNTVIQQHGFHDSTIQYLRQPPWQLIDHDLAWQNKPNHHLLTLSDPCYPPLLKEIHDPPPILFIIGNVEVLSSQQIAIVGSRNPSTTGCEIATQIAMELAQIGFCI